MSVASGLRRLGDPSGKTERQWIAAMKRGPSAISDLDNGHQLLQWHSGIYVRQHIAVVFDAQHLYVKITHRYRC